MRAHPQHAVGARVVAAFGRARQLRGAEARRRVQRLAAGTGMEEGADGGASVAGAGDGGRGGASEQAGEELLRWEPRRLRWRRCLLLLRLLLRLLWGLRSSFAVFGVAGPREVVAAQAPEEGARGVAREGRRGRVDDGGEAQGACGGEEGEEVGGVAGDMPGGEVVEDVEEEAVEEAVLDVVHHGVGGLLGERFVAAFLKVEVCTAYEAERPAREFRHCVQGGSCLFWGDDEMDSLKIDMD